MSGATIGIDVRKIRDYGIGRYVEGLLRAFAEDGGDERYVLFESPAPERAVPPALRDALPADRFSFQVVSAPLYSVRELLAFRGVARRFGLDLLHFPHYVRGAGAGCPAAVTVHDVIHLSHPPSLRARLYAEVMLRRAVHGAAVVFTVSEAARSDLAARLRMDARRIRVTPNGVDGRFVPPDREELDAFRARRGLRRPFVLCMASHRPHKNLAAALDAFARARPEGGKFVVPARDDEAAVQLVPLVEPRGGRLLVGVPDGELPLLYAAARIVLCPSLAEGFGLTGLEAAACGATVLATAIPAHVEVLGDGAAYVPADGLAPDIASGIGHLWDNRDARADLSRRGAARGALFPWSDTGRLTRQGYRAAIEGPRPADL